MIIKQSRSLQPRPNVVTCRNREYNGNGAIYLYCKYSESLVNRFRQYPKAYWRKSLNCWMFPRNRSAAKLIFDLLPDVLYDAGFKSLLGE